MKNRSETPRSSDCCKTPLLAALVPAERNLLTLFMTVTRSSDERAANPRQCRLARERLQAPRLLSSCVLWLFFVFTPDATLDYRCSARHHRGDHRISAGLFHGPSAGRRTLVAAPDRSVQCGDPVRGGARGAAAFS